jgi:hypothetical protein
MAYLFLFLSGVGSYKEYIALPSIVGLFFYLLLNLENIKHSFKILFGFLNWFTFLSCYYFFYIPPLPPVEWQPNSMDLNNYIYCVKSLQVLLVYLVIATQRSSFVKFQMLSSVSLGMMFYASLNAIFTILYLDPPYYGKAYHSIYRVVMNSPGTTILGGIASICLLSFYSSKLKKNRIYKFMLVLAIFAGISISLLYSARTLFFIFVIYLIIFSFLNFKTNSYIFYSRKFVIFILLLLLLTLTFGNFLYFEHLAVIKKRIFEGEYRVKFQHTIDYFLQVKENFFSYPIRQFTYRYNDWFHNFFFDTHRTSGPITAIILYFLLGYTFFFSFRNMIARTFFGKELLILYICFFPYLYTTIPWESGENQMITFYAGFVAMILSDK